MMSFRPLWALALSMVAAGAQAEAADPVGIRTVIVAAPERDTPLTISVWYPAAPGGTPVLVGDNAVFAGAPARGEAPVADGRFPLILLSHGGLRSAPGLDSWIAARLAAQGFIVAAPRASGVATADAPGEIWRRSADISATLTALEGDADLSGRIDPQQIGVLGFQLGGTAALALAGARIDPAAYAGSCDGGGGGVDCAWFKKNGIDLHAVDAAKVGRSNADPRIGTVVVVNPEYAAAFTASSLADISVPVHVVNLGAPDTIPSWMRAAILGTAIPNAHYRALETATPFDAFKACKPEGRAILRDEGDDEGMCKDGARPRAETHAQLAELIAAAFAHHWESGL